MYMQLKKRSTAELFTICVIFNRLKIINVIQLMKVIKLYSKVAIILIVI